MRLVKVCICLLLASATLLGWKSVRAYQRNRELLESVGIAGMADNIFLADEKESLTKILHAELGTLSADADLDKVKKLMIHHAKVAHVRYHAYDTTKEEFRALPIYLAMRDGGGHLCSGHADLFMGMLEIYGIASRRIIGESLRPDDPDFDRYSKTEGYSSHSTVEVLIDGRWILADPLYGVMPKYRGRYVSVGDALQVLCRDRSAHFEFDMVSNLEHFDKTYHGRNNDFFRDLMFSRVIVYKPFHKYPYDDVQKAQVRTAQGPVEIRFTVGCGMTVATLTPPEVPRSVLPRDRSMIEPIVLTQGRRPVAAQSVAQTRDRLVQQ